LVDVEALKMDPETAELIEKKVAEVKEKKQ
jgi:hypothetical protein